MMTPEEIRAQVADARRSLEGNMATEGSTYWAIRTLIDLFDALAHLVGQRKAGIRELRKEHDCQSCTDTQPCERAQRMFSGEGS